MAHNHPSGDPTPSSADLAATGDIVRAGQVLKIDVMDHVIIGIRTNGRANDYFQFANPGWSRFDRAMIHRTAIIAEGAEVDPSCEVGPSALIDGQVRLGPGCRLAPHVHLTGLTQIGSNNIFHTGCVIGDAPQDLKYKDEPTGLRIGDGNVFREHVTVHRSAKLFEER